MLILGMCQNWWLPSLKVLQPLLVWHFQAMKVRLFIYSLELKRTVSKLSAHRTPSTIRRQRELRRLEFSVNYDWVSASSNGMLVSYVQDAILKCEAH